MAERVERADRAGDRHAGGVVRGRPVGRAAGIEPALEALIEAGAEVVKRDESDRGARAVAGERGRSREDQGRGQPRAKLEAQHGHPRGARFGQSA